MEKAKQRHQLRMEGELWERAQRVAVELDRSVSWVIRAALERYIERHEETRERQVAHLAAKNHQKPNDSSMAEISANENGGRASEIAAAVGVHRRIAQESVPDVPPGVNNDHQEPVPQKSFEIPAGCQFSGELSSIARQTLAFIGFECDRRHLSIGFIKLLEKFWKRRPWPRPGILSSQVLSRCLHWQAKLRKEGRNPLLYAWPAVPNFQKHRDVLRHQECEAAPFMLGPAREFARYQTNIRKVLKPNSGENFEGRLAHKFLDYLSRRGGRFVSRRDMFRDTRAYDFGPSTADRALSVLHANGDIEISKIGRQVVVRYVPENDDSSGQGEIVL